MHHHSTPHLKSPQHLSKNVNKATRSLTLSEKDEFQLVKDWIENKDSKALGKIIKSHEKLVKSIARKYQGYGLPMEDLIAEAHIGIIQAIKGFDITKGFRFGTYARWWIRSAIQVYVMNSWSMVKMVTTAVQKKLFFGLRSKINKQELQKGGTLEAEDFEKIAKENDIPLKELLNMYGRLRGKDDSLNKILDEDSETEWQDLLPDNQDSMECILAHNQELSKRFDFLKEGMICLNDREKTVIQARRLSEPPEKLEDIAAKMSLTKQRVHQIELTAFKKLQTEITRLARIYTNH